MKKEQLVKKLNGIEYRTDIPKELLRIASEKKLLIIHAASDDLVIIDGFISDELDAFRGVEFYISSNGEVSLNDGIGGEMVEAIFCPKYLNTLWLFETDIPHATFDIMEDGELYCRGLVIDLNEIY